MKKINKILDKEINLFFFYFYCPFKTNSDLDNLYENE